MLRTTFLSASLAALMLAGACGPQTPTPTPTESATPTPVAIAPFPTNDDVKPFAIGAFQAAALRDGFLSFPNDNKVVATNRKKKDVADLLVANGLKPEPIELSLQPLIVRTTDKTLLFDTGASGLFGPTLGKMPVSLYAASVGPEEINDIFISHGHGDHVGGLVSGQKGLAFPNATIHMSESEWTALKADKAMAELVGIVTPKVVEFQPGAEIIPGVVMAMDIKGHTPGHSGYLITSGDQSLLYIGDAMHHSVVSVQQPDWTIAFDGDAKTAQASRKDLLAHTVATNQRVYAPHFPFPGLGKFEKKGDGYVWTPEP